MILLLNLTRSVQFDYPVTYKNLKISLITMKATNNIHVSLESCNFQKESFMKKLFHRKISKHHQDFWKIIGDKIKLVWIKWIFFFFCNMTWFCPFASNNLIKHVPSSVFISVSVTSHTHIKTSLEKELDSLVNPKRSLPCHLHLRF